MLIHHVPEPRRIRIGRHAFKHHRCRAIDKRAIDYICVPCHPANIGPAPIDIILFQIENIFMGHRSPNQIAARGVQHAFGFARRARGIKNKERIFRAHGFWWAII